MNNYKAARFQTHRDGYHSRPTRNTEAAGWPSRVLPTEHIAGPGNKETRSFLTKYPGWSVQCTPPCSSITIPYLPARKTGIASSSLSFGANPALPVARLAHFQSSLLHGTGK